MGRLKQSSDLYRTIKGGHYVGWLSYYTEERRRAYRAAGLRVARRGVELFLHEDDQDAAAALEERLTSAGRLQEDRS